MFSGSKYVQNKDAKEILISQSEVAAKITKVPDCPARKRMRENLADKAEILAFRGVSGGISWLAGQTRPVLSSVSITANVATTCCCSSLCVKHGGTSCALACSFGSQDLTNARTKHGVAVAC